MFKLKIKLLRNYKRRKGVDAENEEDKKHKMAEAQAKLLYPFKYYCKQQTMQDILINKNNYKNINVRDLTKNNLTKNKENSIHHNHHSTLTTSTLIIYIFKCWIFQKIKISENKILWKKIEKLLQYSRIIIFQHEIFKINKLFDIHVESALVL